MPLYDFECPHGHRFERLVLLSESDTPIPCEGIVNRLLLDSDLVTDETKIKTVDVGGEEIQVEEVPCILQATRIFGTHSNPHAILQHGMAANRDAAREGRYDPNNPNRRFMAKGREWRK